MSEGTIGLVKTETRSEDAPKSCDELSGRKLLSPEAGCSSKILENCISEVEFVLTLPAFLKLNSLSCVADTELSRALQEHQTLAERLETLEGLRQESGGEQEKGSEERAQRDFKKSVKNLLRLVRARPDVISDFRAEQDMEVGESESILINELKKFHSHMAEKLLTSVSEELKQTLYKPTSSPPIPSHTLDLINSAEEKLSAAITEKDAEISQQNIEIENLQSCLEEKNKEEAALSISGDKQHPHVKTVKMIRLEQEIDQLKTQLKSLKLEHRQAEGVILEKNEELEKEIESLLQNFDADIGELQTHLDVIEKDHEKELEELRKQEQSFSVLEVEFNQIQEKHRLEEEKRKQEMKDLVLKTKAAIYAQAWWRGYMTRKALKNKGKSKKAKKGKGKKIK
ncbi:dynein regulatory complex protein 10 [Labrus mixtus]|uniref:dynein regulatory complex protein 10 n=1 Tax=Labrus mixtus TaxID=508554 RepID=UPI0029C05899|nr:dynein regulatory complex protein 10 [Labrus mixtus]XP_060894065.1 dynein regulatory complex protein 10 [Labrus mixtus]